VAGTIVRKPGEKLSDAAVRLGENTGDALDLAIDHLDTRLSAIEALVSTPCQLSHVSCKQCGELLRDPLTEHNGHACPAIEQAVDTAKAFYDLVVDEAQRIGLGNFRHDQFMPAIRNFEVVIRADERRKQSNAHQLLFDQFRAATLRAEMAESERDELRRLKGT